MHDYSAAEVGRVLGWNVRQVRACVAAQLVTPSRGPRGEYRFSFQDLVVMRTAKGLMDAAVPRQRIRQALTHLRRQLPPGRPITALQITSDGTSVIARDEAARWQPESGQVLFDFDGDAASPALAPLGVSPAPLAAAPRTLSRPPADLARLLELAGQLESLVPTAAQLVYERALELDPDHAEAHLALGRLLHEEGRLARALMHYRRALCLSPEDASAAFCIAVALEDGGDVATAIDAYRHVVALQPGYADAHYQLARIFQERGDHPDAHHHLRRYQELTRS